MRVRVEYEKAIREDDVQAAMAGWDKKVKKKKSMVF
jgi:hypothetical protein